MAYWDKGRGAWRVATGEGRRTRLIHEPHTKAGRLIATAEEAQAKAARVTGEGKWWRTDRIPTFAEAAAMFLATGRDRLSEGSYEAVANVIRLHLLPELGELRLDEISPGRIEKLYAEWVKKGYAPSTRKRWHSVLGQVFRGAVRRQPGLAVANPMVAITAPGRRAPERLNIPTPAQVRRAITMAPTADFALFVTLAAHTGARRGTLCALRWSDVDVDAGVIFFSRAMARGYNNRVFEKGTKADRPYRVVVTGRALERLRDAQRRARATAMALGLAGQLESLRVFSTDGGLTPWRPTHPTEVWCHLRDRLTPELNGIRLHDLRHYAATQMLLGGIPTRVVAERLGCTETNIIHTYSHYLPSDQDLKAAQLLDGLG